jgi:hypothetical protein
MFGIGATKTANARVAKSADATDLKFVSWQREWGFKSPRGHQPSQDIHMIEGRLTKSLERDAGIVLNVSLRLPGIV